MTTAPDPIEVNRAEFLRAKATLERALATTADDRVAWSPAPTARTPAQIVAHAADSIRHLHNTFLGIVFPLPTSAEGDRSFREWEAGITTREAALAVLEENSAAYLAWLDALPAERLDETVEFPYAMGAFPIRLGITFVPAHTFWHAAQIEYVQTIAGDRDWHTGF